MEKENKGITLIALIITVIIMLILAGIVLNLTTGERGIFKTAKEASKNYVNASKKELAELNSIEENLQIPKDEDANNDTILARYLLIEVNGYLSGDSAVINELEVYDKNGDRKNYLVLKNLEYDSVMNGKSKYWEHTTYWNRIKLDDGKTSYTSNKEGGLNCTLFLCDTDELSNPNNDDWARFIIDLGNEYYIKDIDIWLGGVEGRMPYKISIFTINNFVDGIEENTTYAKNIVQRNNEGLNLITTKIFSESPTQATKFRFLTH